MKYAVIYSSRTGNTAILAEKIQEILSREECVYSGAPDGKGRDADWIFVGFWTDKGSCDEDTAAFLETLRCRRVFLFGTAGFGGSEEYFSQILSRAKQHLDGSNTVAGTYMCQGKMSVTVRKRYESMIPENPEKARELIDNFDRALSHPDEEDLERLEKAVDLSLNNPAGGDKMVRNQE